MAINAPTGTKTPTDPEREGTRRNRMTINNSGATEIFQFLLTYTTARPPNRDGSILSNAGFTAGLFKMGVSGTRSATPRAITMVVTIEEVATAMVDITSPFSVPGFTLAFSMAVSAAGTFRFVRFPVTKAR